MCPVCAAGEANLIHYKAMQHLEMLEVIRESRPIVKFQAALVTPKVSKKRHFCLLRHWAPIFPAFHYFTKSARGS